MATSSNRSRRNKASGAKKAPGIDTTLKNNIIGAVLIACGALLFIAVEFDAAGRLGHYVGDFSKGCFGVLAFVLPFYLFFIGSVLVVKSETRVRFRTIFFSLLISLSLCLFMGGIYWQNGDFTLRELYTQGTQLIGAGVVGSGLAALLIPYLGRAGLFIVSLLLFFISLMLLVNKPLSHFLQKMRLRRAERAALKELRRQDEALRREEKLKIDEAFREKKLKEEEKFLREQRKMEEIKYKEQRLASREMLRAKSQLAAEEKAQHFAKVLKEEPEGTEPEAPDKAGKPAEIDRSASPAIQNGGGDAEPEQLAVSLSADDLKKPAEDAVTSSFAAEEEMKEEEEREIPIRYGIEESRHVQEGYGLEGGKNAEGIYSVNNASFTPVLSRTTDEGSFQVNRGIDPISQRADILENAHGKRDRGVSPSFGKDKNGDADARNAVPSAAGTGGSPDAQTGQNKPQEKISEKEARAAVLSSDDFNQVKKPQRYRKPPINLLVRQDNKIDRRAENAALRERAETLENTLKNFNVGARILQVTKGPAVTRYEIQPNVGVKVNKIVNLADDIALNLRAKSIRIEAPIPGKAAVGIEVENEKITMVTIREIVESKAFREANSRITFAVGKDIAGKAVVADLKSMPHLLIAGSTGSGKSVCINSIIASILYKADPDEVKMVLIDPKVVELGNYNGIPHLLIPVVTDPAKAAAALNWAVAEMTDRYKKFAGAKARDLAGYNEIMKNAGEPDKILPQVVIIIDELADLMMAAPSQVEESIARLAQMARAAGMHLIVATQRPSVDIITGLIKANIPSRIAFAVSSQFDSRTILDMGGAERLVGKGDMLFHPLGIGKPVRVQGCFISDAEVRNLIEYVKEQVDQEDGYVQEVIEQIDHGDLNAKAQDAYADELIPDAIDVVLQAQQASVSMLQRRFRIGYNRAARIVDELENMGLVGPQDGSRPRQVYFTEEEWQKRAQEQEEEA